MFLYIFCGMCAVCTVYGSNGSRDLFSSLPTLEQFGAECDVTRLKISAV